MEQENNYVDNYIKYNFDRPDKFSFENLKSLESIFSIFSRNLSADFANYLRMPVEVEVESVEQVLFQKEYLSKQERFEKVFCTTSMDGEQILIQFDMGFLLNTHSKQLGGKFGKLASKKKNITEFEQITMVQILDNFVYPRLSESFKSIKEIEFKSLDIETDPQYVRITLPQDMISLATFNVKIEDQETIMKIAIPHLAVEDVIDNLNIDEVTRNNKNITPEVHLSNLYKNILEVEEDFVVNLGEKKLSLKTIRSLTEGSVIVLDDVGDNIKCAVNKREKFEGYIGISQGRYSVKLSKVIKDEDTEDDLKENAKKIQEINHNLRKRGTDSDES